jgi:uncharacterized membrane protein YozB (DUF420 family)
MLCPAWNEKFFNARQHSVVSEILERNRMAGLLGTTASLSIDLNLILQIVMLIIIGVGFFYKRAKNYRMHGSFMGVAVILHILSFTTVMGPRFRQNFNLLTTATSELGVQTIWIHIIPGTTALILGILLVGAWAIRPSNIAGCFRRKRIMDITITLWLISLIFGIVTYLLFYL